MECAVAMLNRRAFCIADMTQRLKKAAPKHGYTVSDIKETVARLQEIGYLDDVRYSLNCLTGAMHNHGRYYITQNLKQKGVEEETIAAAFETWEAENGQTLEDYWHHQAKQTLQKRFKQPLEDLLREEKDPAEHQKRRHKEYTRRLSFLIRRGFTMKQARGALETSAPIDV